MSFWKSLIASGETTQLDASKAVLEFAAAKLVGKGEHRLLLLGPSIAVVAQRLLLKFEPDGTAARNTEESLVNLHMRTLYSVPEHREYLIAGSSSEPILAEAAAAYMNGKKSEDGYVDSLNTLMDVFSGGMKLKGKRSSLVGRLLDILAIERCRDGSSAPTRHTIPSQQTNSGGRLSNALHLSTTR